MMMKKTTRSNQMMTMSRILSGISVPMMQGMLAEKKKDCGNADHSDDKLQKHGPPTP